MKNTIKYAVSTLFFSFFLSNAISQDVGDLVRLKMPTLVKEVKSIYQNEIVKKSATVLNTKTQFIVLSKTTEEVKLKASPNYSKLTNDYIQEKIDKNEEPPVDFSEIYNNKIYTISKSDFDLAAYNISENSPVSLGIITLPFKARPQGSFTFDTEFNLNTTLNIRMHSFKSYSLNLQLGAGIGSVNLNSNNAPGVAEEDAQDVATLTGLTGLMVEHKRLQIGIYMGIDHINNQDNFRWENNGNLWIAFGVGYDLFDIVKSDGKNDNNK